MVCSPELPVPLFEFYIYLATSCFIHVKVLDAPNEKILPVAVFGA
jgi:hypothetical protein